MYKLQFLFYTYKHEYYIFISRRQSQCAVSQAIPPRVYNLAATVVAVRLGLQMDRTRKEQRDEDYNKYNGDDNPRNTQAVGGLPHATLTIGIRRAMSNH